MLRIKTERLDYLEKGKSQKIVTSKTMGKSSSTSPSLLSPNGKKRRRPAAAAAAAVSSSPAVSAGQKQNRTTATTTPTTSNQKGVKVKIKRQPQRIIVLGAGVSGLACSQELRQRGYEVLVVEARSRVGGRLKGEVLEMGNEYPSTIPIPISSSSSSSSSKRADKNRIKKVHSNNSGGDVIMTRQHAVDVGGALIHGIDDNPMYDITSQMGVPVHPVSSYCLLMDENGWPFDPKEDEKMDNFFNECLDVTFARAEQDRDSKESFGSLFENVCREKSGSSNNNSNGNNGTASSPSKNGNNNGNNNSIHNNNWENPLLKWHRANLELPTGASFYDLGNTWNEDEPFGFDGAHAAVECSWKLIMERLADGLEILNNSPVIDIRVVLPNGTTPLEILERATNIDVDDDGDDNDNLTAAATTITTNDSDNDNDTTTDNIDDNDIRSGTELAEDEKRNSTEDITQLNEIELSESPDEPAPDPPLPSARRRRPTIVKIMKEPTKPINSVPETRRFSRRVRDLDVDVRRSSRSTKGVMGEKLEFGHDNSISYDYPSIAKKRRKRQRKMNRNDDANTQSGITNENEEEEQIEEAEIIEEDPSSTVQVTLQNGVVLEADALVCTLPLGVLKLPHNEPGHVRFVPSLSPTKKNAIQELGCGLLNKCAISFPTAFWQDSDFLGKAEMEYSYLVLNAMKYTQKPILIFMYGGDFALDVEDWTDKEIISDCLDVLKKICGREIPAPVDYCITRWGQEQYSRMAFTYIPPGVDGKKALGSISQPVHDPVLEEKPLIMFAGEHTTPYHPSTMHGAFLSGIREAYRFDLFMEPLLNDYMQFEDSVHVYQHTFPTKRVYKKNTTKSPKKNSSGGTSDHLRTLPHSNKKQPRRGGYGGMTLRKKPNADATSTSTSATVATPTNIITTTNNQKTTSTGGSGRKTPDVLTATRRSQRSLGSVRKAINMSSPTSRAKKSSGDNDNDLNESLIAEQIKLENKKNTNQQEDRTLVRALESYGQNYNLLQSKVLPVYGSTRKRSTKQICDRWQRLVSSSSNKRLDLVSSWQTKRVVTDNWDTHMARIAADVASSSDTTNNESSVRRSHRDVKPKSLVDM